MLSRDWFVEPHIDFELKKYLLLAYLQHAGNELNNRKLLPFQPELQSHLQSVLHYKKQRVELENKLRKEIEALRGNPPSIVYRAVEESESALLNEIEMIVDFSIEKLKSGNEMFSYYRHEWKKSIRVSAIGLLPVYTKEGYLFLLGEKHVDVFDYNLQGLFTGENKFVSTCFINRYDYTVTSTLEQIKREVTREHEKYATPAVFAFESDELLPAEETLLPLAKEILAEMM